MTVRHLAMLSLGDNNQVTIVSLKDIFGDEAHATLARGMFSFINRPCKSYDKDHI